MRKTGATFLVAASLVGTLSASPAFGQDRLVYRGHLSDGSPIAALVIKGPAGNLRLRELRFQVVFECEDSTSQEWGLGFGFFPGEPLPERMLTLDTVDPDLALHIHGRFGTHHASGDLSATIPALTVDEAAQLCSTGDLTWTMRRRPASRMPAASADAAGRIHVRVGPSGTNVAGLRVIRS